MPPLLIGVNGLRGSGKNTVADIIKEQIPGAELDAFATSLKVSAMRSLGLPDNIEQCDMLKELGSIQISLGSDEVWGLTFREYLQWYGTEGHRDLFGESFWTDQVMEKYMLSQAPLYVVTDCRFPNEVELIHRLGGEVWKVHRSAVEIGDTHASEKPLDDSQVDAHIYNEGTIEELKFGVEQLLVERELL